jgi:hypothetical protein
MFISAVYFIIAFAFADNNAGHIRKVEKIKVTDNSGLVTEVTIDSLHIIPTDNTSGANKIKAYFEKKTIKIASAHHMPTAAYLKEKLWHTVPKLMFFMIPVLAWLLKIRFSARKELDFVDHTIFALHTHCFWFSIRLFSLVEVNRAVGFFVDLIFFVIFFIYMLRAITNVYQVGRFNAAITLLGIAFAYTFALSILTVTTLALYFMMA